MRIGTATLILAIAMGASAQAHAQELPTTPAAVCKDRGNGKGTFDATTKTATKSVKKRRLTNQGAIEVVDVFETTTVDLRELSAAYVSGEWTSANDKATALLGRIRTCLAAGEAPDKPGANTAIFDLRRDYVNLLWVSTVPATSDPTIFSMLVHSPALPPYWRVLPGLSDDKAPRLFEVFLSENLDAAIASYYVSKPLADPLLDQVPQVVEKFLGPLFTLFDRVEPVTVDIAAVGLEKPQIRFIVKQVQLPEPRAGVEISARASLPITQEQLRNELTTLAVNLEAQGLSTPFKVATKDTLKKLLDLIGKRDDPDCGEEGNAADCKRALHEGITTVFGAERQSVPADPRRRELDRLEAAFHTFVDGLKPAVVTGKAALDNSPLTHLTFGLLTSYAFKVEGDDLRAKVDGGKVVNAPLTRALQMVVLNISPWGYQSKTIKRWIPRAFFQPFVGVVFSPDVGVGAGVSFRVLSNLGFNAGYAQLFITRPEDGLSFGAVLDEKVKDENGKDTSAFVYAEDLRRDPLQTGRLHTLFLGVSYNFK